MRRVPSTVVLLLALAGPAAAQDARPLPQTPSQERPEAEVFLSTLEALTRMSLHARTDSALWEAGIQGMLESLQDPYAAVFTPAESEAWEEETTGNYSGIGLQITLLNEAVTVTAVFRNTPAADAGVQVGDIIVGVNEQDATGWNTSMAADSIRGPVGTKVWVRLKRDGFAEPIPFEITRAEVHVPAVSYGMMEGNIGYALLDRVARNAAQEMDQALRELKGARGLIIDLRRNPGGFLDESLMLADIFLKPGATLASTAQRVPGGAGQMDEETYTDRWPARVPDLPVIVLVDQFTASGAEIFAGALQDYDRALVMGERSFGKGLVQTVIGLPQGRRLRFTTGEWRTPLGRSLQRPRDMEMRPLEEKLDTLPRITTPSGRSLLNAGGVFPDIAIAEDTLTLAERELLRVAGEKEIALGVRLAEFSFELAKELRAKGAEPAVDPARLDAFVDGLVDSGIPAEALQAPGVRDYLLWRTRMTVANRMDAIGREADFRMERDPVLTEAVRLLGSATSQAELLRTADDRMVRGG
ncbi:MAG TPA: S41 family peptidase [Longimicrobiales bacterium]|nr:S41 family peptidase [Longimicrobiales bacterium]